MTAVFPACRKTPERRDMLTICSRSGVTQSGYIKRVRGMYLL